ncbi:hypothetical protein Tco_1029340 [Tanacetum coccineum]|uniref:Uncharacterized protein n=1 Tax=Tanacetum coccineum TaxID=301880 RepID=A0ABQ5G4Q1_9ASTR
MVDSRVNKIAKKIVLLYVVEGLLLDMQKTQADVAAMIVEAVQKERGNLHAEITLQLTNVIANSIPPQLHNDDLSIWRSLKIKFDKPTTSITPYRIVVIHTRDDEDHHDDDARPKGESSVKRQKTSEHLNMAHTQRSSSISCRSDAELSKDCQRDPKAPPMTLLNQDLFYLKYGNSGPKKYTLSLYKYHAVPFPEDDTKERTSRWVSKQIRRFNVYARYSVEHLKNIWAKQDYIRRQKEQRDKPEEIDLITKPDYKHLNKNAIKDLYMLCINGKVKDYKEVGLLGSLSVFIRSFIIWERVHDFYLGMKSYQHKVNLTAPTITFPSIKRKKLFAITYKPVIGMIYKNGKKEERVMILRDIPKFCDATLKRVLEMLKKYNKDVTYGYVDPSPSDADAEYLQFYEEYIEDRLKHRDQMRCWEMYISSVISLDVIRFHGITRRRVITHVGIDVASTGGNNGFWFWFDVRIFREIKFQKDFVLEDFERFVGSFVNEDCSGIENSLSWIV